MDVSNFTVKKVLVDNGSSANIIFYSIVEKMGLETMRLERDQTPLIGFGGSEIISRGMVQLATSVGTEPRRHTILVDYLVVDEPFTYNIILGRPALNDLGAIPSTYHMKMRFPTPAGVGEVLCDLNEAWKCYTLSVECTTRPKKDVSTTSEVPIKEIYDGAKRKRADESRIEPVGEYKEIELKPGNSSKTTRIGTELDPRAECLLIDFLRSNRDVFAWKAANLRGVDPSIIVHWLNVIPTAKPVTQKERSFSDEKNEIINGEVDELLEAGYIEEVKYAD